MGTNDGEDGCPLHPQSHRPTLERPAEDQRQRTNIVASSIQISGLPFPRRHPCAVKLSSQWTHYPDPPRIFRQLDSQGRFRLTAVINPRKVQGVFLDLKWFGSSVRLGPGTAVVGIKGGDVSLLRTLCTRAAARLSGFNPTLVFRHLFFAR